MFRRNDQLHWTIFRFRHQVLINSWNWLLKASIVSPEKMDLWNVWCFPHSCYPWFLLCKNAVLVRFRPEPPPLQVVQPHHWPVAGVGPASRESPLRIGFENIPSSSRTAPPLTFRTYRIEALSIVLKDETCPISINLNQYPNQYQSISKSIETNLSNLNLNPNQSKMEIFSRHSGTTAEFLDAPPLPCEQSGHRHQTPRCCGRFAPGVHGSMTCFSVKMVAASYA